MISKMTKGSIGALGSFLILMAVGCGDDATGKGRDASSDIAVPGDASSVNTMDAGPPDNGRADASEVGPGLDSGSHTDSDAAGLDRPAQDSSMADVPSTDSALDLPAASVDSGFDQGRQPDVDVPDSGGQLDGGSIDVGSSTLSLTVAADRNALILDNCAVTPALLPNVAAGTYQIQLTASTLSKGGVSGTPQVSAVDDYVIVSMPLAQGDLQAHRRFFMLNGIGATADVTLTATGTIGLMFIDGDSAYNTGEGVVSLTPGGATATVDAATNVLGWQGCASTPASLVVSNRPHRVTLQSSTLSSGAGSRDDYVILRLPSEKPTDDHRWIILNGVGASHDFQPYNSETLRAWHIRSSVGGTGLAIVTVSDL